MFFVVESLIFLDHGLLAKIFIDNEGYVRGIGSVFPFENKTDVVRRLLLQILIDNLGV